MGDIACRADGSGGANHGDHISAGFCPLLLAASSGAAIAASAAREKENSQQKESQQGRKQSSRSSSAVFVSRQRQCRQYEAQSVRQKGN